MAQSSFYGDSFVTDPEILAPAEMDATTTTAVAGSTTATAKTTTTTGTSGSAGSRPQRQ